MAGCRLGIQGARVFGSGKFGRWDFLLFHVRERRIGDQGTRGPRRRGRGFDLKILRKKKRKKKKKKKKVPNGMGLGNFKSIRLNIWYGLHTYNTYNGFYISNY